MQLQAGQREAHGDAVVGVGLDPRRQALAGERRVGGDQQVVALLPAEARTDAGEFRRQGAHPVAFLDAQVGDAGEAHGRAVEHRQHGERGHRVLHLRAVDHARQVREGGDQARRHRVGLGEVRRRQAEVDRAAGQHCRGPQIGGRRGIRLDRRIDRHVAGRRHPPGAPGGTRAGIVQAGIVQAGIADRFRPGPEAAHRGQREVDIAACADRTAFQRHLDRTLAAGGDHQQGGDVLARQAGIDRHPAGRDPAVTLDHHRRTAGTRARLHPEPVQRLHQRRDRALAHVRVAVQHDGAAHQRRRSGQEAHGGTGVAQR